MLVVLSLILLILLIIVGKKEGIKTYMCFYLNYFLIFIFMILISVGFNAIILSIIICLLVASVSLFLTRGRNIKTESSFISIVVVLLFMFFIIFFVGKSASIGGFSYESIEAIAGYSYEINYNMEDVIIGIVLMCTIGTIIDTSISISTALNEVYLNNKGIQFKELYKSGMNVGKDILSTTINTLFFVFLGGTVGLFFWHYTDSIEIFINYKALCQELIELLSCFIGSILVIPITSFITSKKLSKRIDISLK